MGKGTEGKEQGVRDTGVEVKKLERSGSPGLPGLEA